MLQYLENYQGSINVNGVDYSTVKQALRALSDYVGPIKIDIKHTKEAEKPVATTSVAQSTDNAVYQITVRQYMTKPPTIDFDFHTKWNKGVPMPLRVMTGKKIKETKGMVQMELWGEIIGEQVDACMKCGRHLTNPVSRYFGLGPECGGHHHVKPFDTDEELAQAVAKAQAELRKIKWTGWIVKSAIEMERKVRNEN